MQDKKYYIVDYGKDSNEDLLTLASTVVTNLKKESHVITYLTDLPNSLMVMEITQDEFLDHFLSQN